MKRAKSALASLCLIAGFFGSIAAAYLNLWLMLQAHFGILEIAEFQSESVIDSRLFMTLIFATLAISFLPVAWGFAAMMSRRLG